MNPLFRILGLLFLVSVNCFSIHNLGAQVSDVTVTIQSSAGVITVADFSEPVGVRPNEVVTVTVQFAAENAGQDVNVDSLDGGWVSSTSSVVSNEGAVTFTFNATPNPGQNRVVLRHGSRTLRLQFWVMTSGDQDNPSVITSTNQGD